MKQQKMEENLKLKFGKERLTEQLEKRHKERQQNHEQLQELKNQEASASEAIDYFENIFDNKIDEIENTLNSLVPSDITALGISFNQINNSIQELQKYLSNSTIFLTDYKIKMCQNKLNELTGKSDELKTKLIPKKKFGFRNKQILDNRMIIKPAAIPTTETDNKLKEKQHNNEARKQFEWTISNETDRFIQLDENQINNRDVTLSNLTNCVVQLHGHLGSLQMSNLINCIIFSGPVSRSIFGENCTNCKFIVACQQMRLHTSKQCDLYIHVTCRGIIEDCHDIHVTPYNYEYPNLAIDFIKSGLDRTKNNWTDIGDFNWLSPDMPSPNWMKMDELRIIKDWNRFLENYKNLGLT